MYGPAGKSAADKRADRRAKLWVKEYLEQVLNGSIAPLPQHTGEAIMAMTP